jgi:dihydroorotase
VGLKDRGTLSPGAHADITIFDPNKTWKFETQDSRSKSKNTPFNGWEFTGAVAATIVSGKVVYHRDRANR